ncbi:hypothetical protein BDB01DRAFT_728918 [Pilobolus umbonatus]|nr:hypothetical protein BDB01DRAFT_728918 [Pilobolus umbonatus]
MEGDKHEIAIELFRDFHLDAEKLQLIVNQFMEEMKKGLDHEGATVAMIPSYVTGRPTGKEVGKYLALDLGGTNLRVIEFELLGNSEFKVQQEKYVVSDALKTGDMSELCDFIAECVGEFISKHSTDSEERRQLGFTFSFPVNQTAVDRGTLMHWTKGFSCANAVGQDVVVALQDAFHRKDIPVQVAALVNDTVGTLMANAYKNPKTSMGIILGTGTNAAYYEKYENITKWKHDELFEDMVINMEWGAFDFEHAVLPYTAYDNKLDRESINPHYQPFEKMISGMYLGEIVRNVIVSLIDRELLLSRTSSTVLNKQWTFDTAYVSAILDDTTDNLQKTGNLLEKILEVPIETSLSDRQCIQFICQLISRRAARLSACAIAAVLNSTNQIKNNPVVSIDGSVFEHLPHFEDQMREALADLFDDDVAKSVTFELARDGSGFGAAIIAMMAHKKQ